MSEAWQLVNDHIMTCMTTWEVGILHFLWTLFLLFSLSFTTERVDYHKHEAFNCAYSKITCMISSASIFTDECVFRMHFCVLINPPVIAKYEIFL